jgi:lipopolysaccharide transport system permease protein
MGPSPTKPGSELPITVYTPDSRLQHPARMLREMFGDLWAGRELAWRLAVRDISAQYRQAFLGLLWVFILPLANTLTWIFLQGSGMVRLSETALPYAVYVFTETMLWAIFMEALNAPLKQTESARSMLAKLNFPREALIVSGIYQTLFNAAIKIGLLLVGTAISLLLTPVGLLYTDIGRGLPLVMPLLMYVTPVVFPMPQAGWAATLVELNPLSPLILTARDWLTGVPPEFLGAFVVVNLLTLGLLLLVWVVYRLAMPILIERMSA